MEDRILALVAVAAVVVPPLFTQAALEIRQPHLLLKVTTALAISMPAKLAVVVVVKVR
jgi:hypothetical protein